MKFSVIIPAWNEGPRIASGLKRLREISDPGQMELIPFDGDSENVQNEREKDPAGDTRRP